jgi:hypothetical protein
LCQSVDKFHCRAPHHDFGSQIHSFMTCVIKGYFIKTLVVIDHILESYLNKPNTTWDQFISPISETCQPNHNFKYEVKNNNSVVEIDG